MVGSLRWWYIRRTRLPQMWKNERRAYLSRIAQMERDRVTMQEEIDKLKTAAFGTVVMEFRTAVERDMGVAR
jgi:hypothetical protein